MKHFLTKAAEYTNLDPYYSPKNILNMTAKEKANQLIAEYKMILMDSDSECGNEILCTILATKCARLSVRHILSGNPHSNPFNTELNSTFDWWFDVYNELNKDL